MSNNRAIENWAFCVVLFVVGLIFVILVLVIVLFVVLFTVGLWENKKTTVLLHKIFIDCYMNDVFEWSVAMECFNDPR